jgi:hypothetical protein
MVPIERGNAPLGGDQVVMVNRQQRSFLCPYVVLIANGRVKRARRLPTDSADA